MLRHLNPCWQTKSGPKFLLISEQEVEFTNNKLQYRINLNDYYLQHSPEVKHSTEMQ